ncbi:SDR family oxidoreductase [Daejeonella lutea]|uniref:NADP-dependent 3-hydroxy acid dehydrogenase YdfG n=1 Tax=Daejeonella lutea TaxID=572036 RepID=A0A1T5C1S4_9SPHI|nr:SDR family oxidoreductase [Daejeonella lutea]SKB53365.1 NADP-dependent 3-hydroxy acid dehydrogenase YdfG [Daejeonella lutea]
MFKVILVTGASTGIGFESVLLLAKEGHKVYATMRDTSKAGKLESEAAKRAIEINILNLDVQDEKSIASCVNTIFEKEGRLDILVNNAGAGFIRTMEQATMEEIQQVMDVNFYGVIRCTKAVLPIMRNQQSGHIINISSVGGLVGQPVNEIYCAAKFALEGLTESIATYMKPYFGINVSLVEPGGVITEFGNSLTRYFEETGGIKDDDYKPLIQTYMDYRATFTDEVKERVFQKPAQIAEVILKCINDPEPKLRYLSSDGAASFTKLKSGLDPDGEGIKAQVRKGILNK